MKKSATFIAIILLLIPVALMAQSKKRFSLSGTIKDKATGETLPGATVSFTELPGTGVSANSYGYYSIIIPEGTYTALVTYTGYKTDTIRIDLKGDQQNNIKLEASASQLSEVTIKSSTSRSNNILTAPAGAQKLTVEDIKNVPVLLGEKDILKTIQLLPGIVAAGDGKSGFFVRGGDADQNLLLLDEATVYNASHLLGFFSVFNSDAIKDIVIYKSGMPANYGGRLSSVEDIQMNDGNNQKFGVNGGIGLIASRLTVEGPLFNHKGSFIVSARRTYADLFTRLLSDTTVKKTVLYFYDFNLKGNYQINPNNRIFVSGYFGKDYFKIKNADGIDYGNSTATFRWNHIYNNSLFSNTSLIYNSFNYNTHFQSLTNNVTVGSAITDYHIKQDFNYYINASNKLDFGLESIYHLTQPGAASATQASNYNNVVLQKRYSLESAAYVSHEWTASDRLKITYGVRLSELNVLGPGNFYTYDPMGNVNSNTYYGSGKIVKSYFTPEPRVAASYKLNDSSSVKLSYDRTAQNIHLLNNSSAASPTNVYLPSSNVVKPEISDQFSLGYYRTFNKDQFEFSTEVYYKNLQNQFDYKDGANLVGNENIEADLLFGNGRAYGWETYFKKKRGRLTGWISYTLSKTERKINGINNNNYYNASQDQTNHLSIVGLYQASKKWTFSTAFVYSTGTPVTFPNAKYGVDGAPVYAYGERNSQRLQAYNRLDLGATLYVKKTSKIESSWNFSIYNIYGQSNPYTVVFQADPKDMTKTQVRQTTLFKMVPSVTYNFKF
ncbi:TonB-dependent receptor [Mucilaginibacter flavus]|uniref:TonB-dependent receptor n=1 Tax=Mucilaginibacter flavus TaxID=931504 RepID=UPI0025B38027|nr:TonB-dependent receptor [Mucilaginibacter flavus]MDN3584581.1 TonB-dependent receptor [Mucilaginibacter flavus]